MNWKKRFIVVDTFSHNLLKKGYFIIIKLVGIDFEKNNHFFYHRQRNC